MRVAVGTSGYAYKEWKGGFYPPDLPAADMLRYYGTRFRTVEINNTFYRVPSEKGLLTWSAQVPDGFTFVLKASQRITHQKRLKDVSQDVGYFLQTASVLGPKLGPTLFQLPPNLKKDLPLLEDFLSLLPRRWRAALEFRHASWFDDDVYQALRSHNAALCVADTEDENGRLEPTADWSYLRLRRETYDDEQLRTWARRVAEQAWQDAFVFFKHEDEATGPNLAARFLQLFRSDESLGGC